jgi:hypothetical protein
MRYITVREYLHNVCKFIYFSSGTTFYDTFFNKKGAPKKNGDAFIDVIDYLNGYWMPALLVFFIGFITT